MQVTKINHEDVTQSKKQTIPNTVEKNWKAKQPIN